MANILIRNVDMPEDCFACFAYDGEWGECNFNREECCVGRPNWCPLVNVDEMHSGRNENEKRID